LFISLVGCRFAFSVVIINCKPADEIVVPPYKPDDLDDIPKISKQLHDMPAMPKTEW